MFVAPSLAWRVGRRLERHQLWRAALAFAAIAVIHAVVFMALRRGVEENTAQMELASESTYTWYLPDATLKEMSPPRPRAHAGGAAGGSGHRGGRGASRRAGSTASQGSHRSGAAGGNPGGERKRIGNQIATEWFPYI